MTHPSGCTWVRVTLKINPKTYQCIILHIVQSQIISAASYWSLIAMVTQRVDILIAFKVWLNCSPVFLIEALLQKALPTAPRLITQIRVSEGEMWCLLKMSLRGLNGGRLHTFQTSWALEESIVSSSNQGLQGARTNSGFGQQKAG